MRAERLHALMRDENRRTQLMLTAALCSNLIYAAVKLVSGFALGSTWLAALGVYYAALAVTRFSLLRAIRGRMEADGLSAYRKTALLLLALTLTMSALFAQMTGHGAVFSYPGMLIYAMAAYAFSKIISAAVNLVRRRKEENLALAAARCVSFAAALMSMLALQSALIHRFGNGAADFAGIMTGAGGAAVMIALISLSALMLRRASRRKTGC